MSKPSVEQLPLPQLKLGEGPHWNPATQRLYLVDIPTATVYSYCPKTEAVHSSKLEGCDTIGFMTPLKGTTDAFVAGIGTALRLFRWDGSSSNTAKFERVLQELPDEPKTNRINDGKADPTGRLYFGTMKLENIFEGREGSFYSWSKDGGLTKHFSGVGVSNGMAWDQSKGAMYYIDSLNQSVDRFDYEPSSGKISNRRVAFDYAKNDLKTVYPDGMTIDSDGKLWVACYSGSRVINVDPATGQLVSEIPIPTQNVTSVAWGGPDLSDLYVTTFGGEEGNDKSGRTYRVRGLAAKGLPMYDAVV